MEGHFVGGCGVCENELRDCYDTCAVYFHWCRAVIGVRIVPSACILSTKINCCKKFKKVNLKKKSKLKKKLN